MQAAIVFAVLVAIALSALGGSYFQKQAFTKDARSLSYYQETFLRKQGWSQGFGRYELLSFDGGKRWYAVERNDGGAVVILGTADEVFPGLLSRLYGMDALVAYTKKNGPITLLGARAKTDRGLLEAAGFTVTETK